MTREIGGEGEEDLRELFARVRDEETRGMPGFAAFLERPEDQGPEPGPLYILRHWWLPAIGLASAALWLVLPTSSEPPMDLAPSRQKGDWESSGWAMPSDVLLDLSSLPASDLMGDFDSEPSGIGPVREDLGRPMGINDSRVRDSRSLG